MNMKPVSFFVILLCASLILPGLVSAAIPNPVGAGITGTVAGAHLSGFSTNNLTAIGAWNDQVLGGEETITCKELRGRTICYHCPVSTGLGGPVSKVGSSDVPDTLLSLLTALRGGTPSW